MAGMADDLTDGQHSRATSSRAPFRHSHSRSSRGHYVSSWPAAVIRTRIRIAAVHRKSRQMMGFTSDRGPEVAQLAQAPMPRCSPAPINTATQCLYARASSLLSPSSSPAGFPDVRSSPSPELLCRSQRPPSASPQQRWRPPSMLPPPAWMRSSATMTSLTETELLAPCRGRTQNGYSSSGISSNSVFGTLDCCRSDARGTSAGRFT